MTSAGIVRAWNAGNAGEHCMPAETVLAGVGAHTMPARPDGAAPAPLPLQLLALHVRPVPAGASCAGRTGGRAAGLLLLLAQGHAQGWRPQGRPRLRTQQPGPPLILATCLPCTIRSFWHSHSQPRCERGKCGAQAFPAVSQKPSSSGSRMHRIVPSSGGQPLSAAATPFAARAVQGSRAGCGAAPDSSGPASQKVKLPAHLL